MLDVSVFLLLLLLMLAPAQTVGGALDSHDIHRAV